MAELLPIPTHEVCGSGVTALVSQYVATDLKSTALNPQHFRVNMHSELWPGKDMNRRKYSNVSHAYWRERLAWYSHVQLM